MNYTELVEQIHLKKSFLCVGLDTDLQKLPVQLNNFSDPVFEFNKQIIDATHHFTVAYKPNMAFYECQGTKGWESLGKTIRYLKTHYPNVFTIADAKRGDIGNTSRMYAKAFFETLGFDAVTVAPYMGADSVEPFLEYPGKWVILLALTSNEGASDFQFIKGQPPALGELYKTVIRKATQWGTKDNLMFVTGATKADMLMEIRDIVPEHFLLVPGVGAQGGSLTEVAQNGFVKSQCGLLVNSSRDIIYASPGEDFAQVAAARAAKMQQEMQVFI